MKSQYNLLMPKVFYFVLISLFLSSCQETRKEIKTLNSYFTELSKAHNLNITYSTSLNNSKDRTLKVNIKSNSMDEADLGFIVLDLYSYLEKHDLSKTYNNYILKSSNGHNLDLAKEAIRNVINKKKKVERFIKCLSQSNSECTHKMSSDLLTDSQLNDLSTNFQQFKELQISFAGFTVNNREGIKLIDYRYQLGDNRYLMVILMNAKDDDLIYGVQL